jgi:hypothetical protein
MRLIIVLFLGLSISCSPVKIVSTTPEEFSLVNYKTFNFYEVNTQEDLTPTLRQRIEWLKNEISKQLSGRGLTQNSERPDLLVNLGIVIEEKVQTRETTLRDSPPMYVGQRNYTWQSQEVPVGTYKEGTLTVDLVDRENNERVWEGVASSVVVKNDESARKNIATGVEKLFADIK